MIHKSSIELAGLFNQAVGTCTETCAGFVRMTVCRIPPSKDFRLFLAADFHERKLLFAGLDLRHRLPQYLHEG